MRILGIVGRGNLRTLLILGGALTGRPSVVSACIGTALVVAGAALHLYAKGCLTQNRALTTGGAYRWTRNPFYLANLAIDGGLCVVANQPALAVVALLLWVPIYGATIHREERELERRFGDAFRRYAARVPRFIPWRSPLPRAEAGPGFSVQNRNLTEGSEYARLFGILSGPLWIIVPRALWHLRIDSAHVLATLAGVGLLAALHALNLSSRSRSRRARPLSGQAQHEARASER